MILLVQPPPCVILNKDIRNNRLCFQINVAVHLVFVPVLTYTFLMMVCMAL